MDLGCRLDPSRKKEGGTLRTGPQLDKVSTNDRSSNDVRKYGDARGELTVFWG